MKPKIKPIRDLYFRFIQGTRFEGTLEPQDAALKLSRLGLIELVPHRSEPVISHYRDIDLELTDKKAWAVFLSCMALVVLSGCAKSGGDQCGETIPPSDGRPTILVIGDSISIGYTPYLQAALPSYQVVHNPCNAQYSEHTASNILVWLDSRPSFYAITFNNGLWDIADWVNTPYHDYEVNETFIANTIKAKTSRPLFNLSTGVPLNTPHRLDSPVAAFNALIGPTMQGLGVPVLDLYGASHAAPIVNEHVTWPDGTGDAHYTPQGYSDLANVILTELKNRYSIQ